MGPGETSSFMTRSRAVSGCALFAYALVVRVCPCVSLVDKGSRRPDTRKSCTCTPGSTLDREFLFFVENRCSLTRSGFVRIGFDHPDSVRFGCLVSCVVLRDCRLWLVC